MGLTQWNSRYLTGILAIDDQHKTLFATVNRLHDGLLTGRTRAELNKHFAFLLAYAAEHFRDEEFYMAKHGFPGLAGHRIEHAHLLQEATAFQEAFLDPAGSMAPEEVARFLQDWLLHHIQHTDFLYVVFVQNQAKQPR